MWGVTTVWPVHSGYVATVVGYSSHRRNIMIIRSSMCSTLMCLSETYTRAHYQGSYHWSLHQSMHQVASCDMTLVIGTHLYLNNNNTFENWKGVPNFFQEYFSKHKKRKKCHNRTIFQFSLWFYRHNYQNGTIGL